MFVNASFGMWQSWLVQVIYNAASSVFQAMALPSGFSTTLSNPIGIRLVLLGLVVMPTTELVLPFNVDGHLLTPTTPDLILLTLLLCEDMRVLRPLLQLKHYSNHHPTNSDDPGRVLWIS